MLRSDKISYGIVFILMVVFGIYFLNHPVRNFMMTNLPTNSKRQILPFQAYFIVWNIGQGQFTTFVEKETCKHFDIGGERNIFIRLQPLCANKMNLIFISHWDYDHISFLDDFVKSHIQSCFYLPELPPTSKFALSFYPKLQKCVGSPNSKLTGIRSTEKSSDANPRLNGDSVQKIFPRGKFELGTRLFQSKKNMAKYSNDGSSVYFYHHFLIPGDSTLKMEKLWAPRLMRFSQIDKIKILILGHHGSHTSTGQNLLDFIRPVMAVSSARKAKYGHPHKEVILRLQKNKIPLLRTEDWGNLFFET